MANLAEQTNAYKDKSFWRMEPVRNARIIQYHQMIRDLVKLLNAVTERSWQKKASVFHALITQEQQMMVKNALHQNVLTEQSSWYLAYVNSAQTIRGNHKIATSNVKQIYATQESHYRLMERVKHVQITLVLHPMGRVVIQLYVADPEKWWELMEHVKIVSSILSHCSQTEESVELLAMIERK